MKSKIAGTITFKYNGQMYTNVTKKLLKDAILRAAYLAYLNRYKNSTRRQRNEFVVDFFNTLRFQRILLENLKRFMNDPLAIGNKQFSRSYQALRAKLLDKGFNLGQQQFYDLGGSLRKNLLIMKTAKEISSRMDKVYRLQTKSNGTFNVINRPDITRKFNEEILTKWVRLSDKRMLEVLEVNTWLQDSRTNRGASIYRYLKGSPTKEIRNINKIRYNSSRRVFFSTAIETSVREYLKGK